MYFLLMFGIIAILMTENKMLNPVSGKITSRFGYRTHPVTGVRKFHNGIDLAARIGTPVLSPAPGIVSSVTFNNTGGNQLVVKHDNGYQTGYAHLSKVLVSVGAKISQGEQIALTGNTGASTGPHLHFVLKKDGDYLDPESIFKFI